MDIYLARQPIFDRQMNIYGYELLYRSSDENVFPGINDEQATSEVISNSFLSMKINEITAGSKAFINFSEQLIIDQVPFLLPNEQIIIEILENVPPSIEVIDACKKFKEAGYVLALDDFNYVTMFQPLLELADIIKIEYEAIDKPGNKQLIEDYKGKVLLLAEKVETRKQFEIAKEKGFSLFQGYFFSKPIMIKGKDIRSIRDNLFQVITELDKSQPDMQKITEIIEKDLGISHKALKLANSTAFGSRTEIYSIKQALIRVGEDELKKWVYLMILHGLNSPETDEMIKMSVVRAKVMESIAIKKKFSNKFEFFLAGMLSSIDVLMGKSMAAVVVELPLVEEVTEALLGRNNYIRRHLDVVISYERAHWKKLYEASKTGILPKDFTKLYLSAYEWASNM